MSPYFISFHPAIKMEENLSIFDSIEESGAQRLIQGALGVILPTYLPPRRYRAITRRATAWFPRLDARFAHQGKTKQILLFRRLGVRHPESLLFESPSELMSHFSRQGAPWDYPIVLKGDLGGGGSTVYPIYRNDDIPRTLKKLPATQPALLQRWVEHGGGDLRVVTYGGHAVSYFRIGDGRFYNNVCRGGRIDRDWRPECQEKGVEAVREFCRAAEIDIAGFDLMFPDEGPPVFIEINFHFGRKGLGGPAGHREHLLRAVTDWCARRLQSQRNNESSTLVPMG